MQSIPMLLQSWTVLFVIWKFVTFPFNERDSLWPVRRE